VPGATLTAAELIGFCRDYIGGYKIPRRYVFLDSLPRSTLHKVLKHELRRRYGDNDGDSAPGTCAGKSIGSGQSVAAAARAGKTPGMAAQDKRAPTIKAVRKAFP